MKSLTLEELDRAIKKYVTPRGITKDVLGKIFTPYAITKLFPTSADFNRYLEKRHPRIAALNSQKHSQYDDLRKTITELLK